MSFPRDEPGVPDPLDPDAGGERAADARVPDAASPPRPLSPAAAAARARDTAIAGSILRLVAARGPAASICPSEAAREVAAAEGRAEWHTLMGNVRRIAGRLQDEGRVQILRKGRPAPADVRGVIRLRLAPPGGAADPGEAGYTAADGPAA